MHIEILLKIKQILLYLEDKSVEDLNVSEAVSGYLFLNNEGI